MKLIKIIFVGILSLLALILILALFIPKDFHVERSDFIERPVDTVFTYIKHLKNHNNFSVWQKMDPNIKWIYTGNDDTPGFTAHWESENEELGVGEQEIIEVQKNDFIKYELRFIKPFKTTNNVKISTQIIDSSNTKVIWEMTGTFKYPSNLLFLFYNIGKSVGKDFESNLLNLKQILETPVIKS